MENTFKSNCLLCGCILVYLMEARTFSCELCGKVVSAEVRCAKGHYICDSCHSSSANNLIENVCVHSESTKPVEMAISLMNAPSIAMHGPEHHFLVPAVLLTAYCNQKKDKTDSTPLSKESWGLSNKMTAESLRCIGALGGPRCCKRDTFMALKTARKFLKQNFETTLDIPDAILCDFTILNQECIEEDCPFHPKEKL